MPERPAATGRADWPADLETDEAPIQRLSRDEAQALVAGSGLPRRMRWSIGVPLEPRPTVAWGQPWSAFDAVPSKVRRAEARD